MILGLRRCHHKIRCLLGRHGEAKVEFGAPGDRWRPVLRYCPHCRHLHDAIAVRGWR